MPGPDQTNPEPKGWDQTRQMLPEPKPLKPSEAERIASALERIAKALEQPPIVNIDGGPRQSASELLAAIDARIVRAIRRGLHR
jgi:hypothetical protein